MSIRAHMNTYTYMYMYVYANTSAYTYPELVRLVIYSRVAQRGGGSHTVEGVVGEAVVGDEVIIVGATVVIVGEVVMIVGDVVLGVWEEASITAHTQHNCIHLERCTHVHTCVVIHRRARSRTQKLSDLCQHLLQ